MVFFFTIYLTIIFNTHNNLNKLKMQYNNFVFGLGNKIMNFSQLLFIFYGYLHYY